MRWALNLPDKVKYRRVSKSSAGLFQTHYSWTLCLCQLLQFRTNPCSPHRSCHRDEPKVKRGLLAIEMRTRIVENDHSGQDLGAERDKVICMNPFNNICKLVSKRKKKEGRGERERKRRKMSAPEMGREEGNWGQ